ncbi:MAG: cellobiose phosphorylase [Candidatus Omnitrophota bacterium]
MQKKIKEKKPNYCLFKEGEFVIENYNFSKPFANFFPGIAGKYGIPMWTFYVNRGQAISSFGIKDKDHSILEFFPANKAWQLVSTQGFRTFIKFFSRKKTIIYEPFSDGCVNLEFDLENRMRITSYGLILEEENLTLGLKIKVEYFNIPNDTFAGLARILTIQNLGNLPKKIQLLDGLPQIVPFGTSNLFLKKLGRTIEAWMKVENLKEGVPFYKLAVDPTDRPEVVHIKEGNFYLGFHYEKNRPKIIKPIVDAEAVFGPITDFSYPRQFLANDNFTNINNVAGGKTPSGFSFLSLELFPKQENALYSVIGYMRSIETLNASVGKITKPGYLRQKQRENITLIDGLTQDINTDSSSREFNLYSKQTYLDNVIRGGYPVIFNSAEKKSVFYLYSRKHGDLERDYNKFQIQPTYFSQGNGNYRDTNQNRRSDIWFNPDIDDDNLITFFSLLQADGFNPLVVKGITFAVNEGTDFEKILKNTVEENSIPEIAAFLSKPYTPGELILFLQDKKIKLGCPCDEFLNIIISHSTKIQGAEHAEGFWTDHWTYNLDLLESYLGLYPEKLKELFFLKRVFTFFDNTEIVKPREDKFLILGGCVKQLHSVYADPVKKELIRKRHKDAHLVRVDYGKGEVYRTTLINKLFCLLVNKLASLDPFGTGVEMEADKPNWFDALNGLPALFGSSACETFELKRLCLIIKGALDKSGSEKIHISEEILDFLTGLDGLISAYFNSGAADKDYAFWDESHTLKEKYRNKTRLGFSGSETEIDTGLLQGMVGNALDKITLGIDKALDKEKNVYYSYFINEVSEYEIIKEHFVKPLKFIQKKVPIFLEGQMHALRLAENKDTASRLHKATKTSRLYDKKLKMYKVTAPLYDMPEEIGRCRVFTPGWLENESIWLHMEYKYLLEILKQGLYEDFYAEFKNILIPFLDPKKYGRSILENSSFLVSSAFHNKALHGNGYVARLSGSTAEFLEIWLTMNVGKSPFFLNDQSELNLAFRPALPGWLFNRKGIYSFNFLSKIFVAYHNLKRKNTFGSNAAKISKIIMKDKEGKPVEIPQNTIPSPYAEQVRSRQIKNIDIYLE